MNPGTQLTIERLAAVPRKVRLQRRTVWLRAGIWAAFIFMFVVIPALGWRRLSRLRSLQADGDVVFARVVSRHVGQGRNSASTMTVAFTYRGQRITATRDLNFAAENYWNSPTVPVTIPPGRLDGWELGAVDDKAIAEEMRAWYGIGGLWGVIVLVFTIGLEVSLASERRLLSKGSVVAGRIISTKLVPKRGTKAVYELETMGAAVQRTFYGDGNLTAQFPPGTEIVVFCLGENYSKTEPLGFFSLVELADD